MPASLIFLQKFHIEAQSEDVPEQVLWPQAFVVIAVRRSITYFTLGSARLELMFPIGEMMGLAMHHADLTCDFASIICCTAG